MDSSYQINLTDHSSEDIACLPWDQFGFQVVHVPVHWSNPVDTGDLVDMTTNDGALFYGTVREREGDNLIIEVE